ncbi:DUF2955 domain-containing protein [uncultured Ferrimonas sp.]|uniref:DUF2955 domain-containing protein n=1 Tax=uncultured Ferrimonas sp. TaxID=432640 RepID=UPI0026156088|nr:DUF2955 domain-containing protein [uncultured Ferrimonas sp.]
MTTMTARLQRRNAAINWHQFAWITAIVSLGMLAQLWLQLGVTAYLALFPVMAVTAINDFSVAGVLKGLLPVWLLALLALLVSELFAAHPAVIWCISVLLFDRIRCWANTPAKIGAAMIPLLNWFLVVVFAQHSSIAMTDWLRDMAVSLVVTVMVVQLVRVLLPGSEPKVQRAAQPKPQPQAQTQPQIRPAVPAMTLTHRHRLVFVSLLGAGLAFMMMVDIVAATFCMMPVIAAAAQTQQTNYQAVIRGCLQAHVGGCAVALLFVAALMGQHHHLLVYGVALTALVALVAYWICTSQGPIRAMHNQAMLGIMLPLQLYLGSTDLGLQDTFQRGGMMLFVLILLLACQGVIFGKQN